MEKINCAVLGCTGIVGQRFIKLLADHQYFNLKMIVASEKNKDKLYLEAVHWIIEDNVPEQFSNLKISNFDIELFHKNNIKIAFSALPPDIAKIMENKLAKNGVAVFSNSRAFRYSDTVPILIPEVNPEHINLINLQKNKYNGCIVTNPNCTTTGLAISLAPLVKYNIKKVFVSSYQALSGAGYPGVSSIDINGNVLPYISGEEEKIIIEVKKILGSLKGNKISLNELDIFPHCARVPVKEGHLESVFVELGSDITEEQIIAEFENFKSLQGLPTAPEKPILVCNENDRPQPALDKYAGSSERTKGMSISIGRIKKQGNFVSFYLLVHNTVRGAAGNSVLNAEFALKQGYLDKILRGD